MGPTYNLEELRCRVWDIKYDGCGRTECIDDNIDDYNRIFF